MKILIVVDMQNDFVTGSLANPEAQKIIPRIKAKIESGDYDRVIFTKDTHSEGYLNTLEGKKLPIPHCQYKTEGWEIVPELKPYSKEEILKLSFGYSCWWEALTGDLIFEDEDDDPIEEIELCGTCTDICVVSNALILRALFPNMPMFVDANACAGSTPQAHKAALTVMQCCQIDVIGE